MFCKAVKNKKSERARLARHPPEPPPDDIKDLPHIRKVVMIVVWHEWQLSLKKFKRPVDALPSCMKMISLSTSYSSCQFFFVTPFFCDLGIVYMINPRDY